MPKRRRADSRAGMLVGTGVACVTKDYGTGADGSLGRVEIDPEGRITIYCDHAEMGNGIGTALANRVATHLGGIADEVSLARSRHIRSARARHLRRPLHHGPGDAGRRAAQSALGAGDQYGHDRLDRRPRRDACGGRGRARHVPLRTVAGGARAVGHRADRSEGRSNGRRRAGKTGSSSCRDCRRSLCRRSPPRRMRATS